MRFPKFSLLTWVILTLVVAGLLPVVISAYQLRTNRDAMLEQVQRTQILSAATAAGRLESWVEALRTVATTVARNPVLQRPDSPAAGELLAGVLQAQPAVAAVAVFDAEGESVLLAQRSELADELAAVWSARTGAPLEVIEGVAARWVKLREPLAEAGGAVGPEFVAVADFSELQQLFREISQAGDAEMVLVHREGQLLAGEDAARAGFPLAFVERVLSGKFGGGAERDGVDEGEQILAHYPVQGATWFVLSRQPTATADATQARIRAATRRAALAGLGLALLLSAVAYAGLVKPLRRLVQAQSRLAGVADPQSGNEIQQLESTFAQLQRVQEDRDSIGEVFLGRYQVLGLLGQGGMGQVFKGYDPVLGRTVALKTLRLATAPKAPTELETQLQAEAAHSARFNHPNVVTVYDFARAGDAAYIAMELVDGVNLDQFLRRVKSLPPDQTIALGAAIASALAAAHQTKLVHGDLKPSNVMLGRDRSIKISDFGTARLLHGVGESKGSAAGTPGYAAPELIVDGVFSFRSDLFAFGVVLYQCLAGFNPFLARQLRRTVQNTLELDPQPIEEVRPSVPRGLAQMVGRLLRKEPERRESDVRAVAEYFKVLAAEHGQEWAPLDDDLAPKEEAAAPRQTSPFLTRRLG